jgi:O-antigen/teichoic acid export membrane protein
MPSLSATFGHARRLATSRSGVLGLTTVGSLALRLVSSLVLTRLLMPEAFGMVGIITSLFFVISMLTDLGFQAYIVRDERGDDPHFLDVIWTVHALRGIALSAIGILSAPLIGWLIAKPAIVWPFAAASLTLALNGLTSLTLMTALRHDGARKLSLLDLGTGVFQLVVNIILAIWLRNVWSLIIAMLLQALLRLVLSYLIFPDGLRRPARDAAIVREFLLFSRVIAASSIITLIVSQLDKVVLARLFTLPEFGLYGLAVTLAAAPVSFGENYISRVVYPIYSSTFRNAPAELANVYYACRWQTTLLYGAGSGVLIGIGSLLIAVLYDPRYAGAGVFLSFLAIGSALRFPSFAIAELITACGEVKGTLRGNVARLIWLGIAAPIGFWQFGTLGLVAAVAFIELPAFASNFWFARKYGVLDARREALYFLIVAGAAAIGFLISTALMPLVVRFH